MSKPERLIETLVPEMGIKQN